MFNEGTREIMATSAIFAFLPAMVNGTLKRIVLISTLALAGCWESEVEKAEKEYRLIEKTPLAEAQLCEAAIKVRDAHLRAGNEKDYELWTIFAQTDCSKSGF